MDLQTSRVGGTLQWRGILLRSVNRADYLSAPLAEVDAASLHKVYAHCPQRAE